MNNKKSDYRVVIFSCFICLTLFDIKILCYAKASKKFLQYEIKHFL